MAAKYALLIGNSSFRHAELARLSAPATDVRDLAAVLEDQGVAGFGVTLKLDIGLVDGRKAITEFYRGRHPDDLLLFYYSGHGAMDTQGEFHLAMTETDPADPGAGSLDATFLRARMDGCASQRQVAVLDCCHAGALIPQGFTARDGGAAVLTRATLDPAGRGRFIMAATTAGASAFEREGRSLYTQHLVEGLRTGAAAPEAEVITVQDLHAHVQRGVAGTTAVSMQPQLWVGEAVNPEPMVIARNPNRRERLEAGLVAMLGSADAGQVEIAFGRLREHVEHGAPALAAAARSALAARLAAGDSLSYALGARIARVLAPPPGPEAELAQQVLLRRVEERIAALTAERDALAARLAEAEAARGRDDGALGAANAALESNLAEVEAERDALAKLVAEVEAERDALAGRVAEVEAERDALAGRVQEAEAERDRDGAALEAASAALESANAAARDAKARAGAIRGECDQAKLELDRERSRRVLLEQSRRPVVPSNGPDPEGILGAWREAWSRLSSPGKLIVIAIIIVVFLIILEIFGFQFRLTWVGPSGPSPVRAMLQ